MHKDKKLKKIFKDHVHYHNKYKGEEKNKRSNENKCHRYVYKILRGLYVSILFYFVPFLVVIVNSFNDNLIPYVKEH